MATALRRSQTVDDRQRLGSATLISLIKSWKRMMNLQQQVSLLYPVLVMFLSTFQEIYQFSQYIHFPLFLSVLQRLLQTEFGRTPSVAVVKAVPKYCQIVREPNRVARLAFCERCLEVGKTFNNIIFSNESSIWIECHRRICFSKKGMPPKLKPKAKHPYKVHVWGGISNRGASNILIFTGIVKKEFYVKSILQDTFLPFVNTTFPDGYRFQQDNDPKRKSKTLKFPNLFLMRLPGKFLCMFVTFRSSSYAVYSR